VSDWLAMLEPLGGGATGSTPPRLDVDDATQRRVDARLLELGVTPGTTLVAMHPSARQEVRRWPLDRFAEVARAVGEMADTRVLVLVDPDGYGQSLEETGAICVRATIPELGAYLRRCSVFVGNDTGPAHIAAAVGTMTVTIFGPGSMEWFRPFGPDQRLVFLDPMPCRPCFDRCTQPTNICLQDLSTGRVILAVREALSDHIESRGQLAGAR
jgi:ADP-heptose:LPS heptosyltransferase